MQAILSPLSAQMSVICAKNATDPQNNTSIHKNMHKSYPSQDNVGTGHCPVLKYLLSILYSLLSII
jgi:hypothetical protein